MKTRTKVCLLVLALLVRGGVSIVNTHLEHKRVYSEARVVEIKVESSCQERNIGSCLLLPGVALNSVQKLDNIYAHSKRMRNPMYWIMKAAFMA